MFFFLWILSSNFTFLVLSINQINFQPTIQKKKNERISPICDNKQLKQLVVINNKKETKNLN